MHSINRANFAILHWFGLKLAPRFTRRQAQLKHLYCGNPIEDYQDCLVQPAGRIDRALIVAEKASIDRIVATLGLKEMSQATLVRKLCALSQRNQTRKAIFEFDKLIRGSMSKLGRWSGRNGESRNLVVVDSHGRPWPDTIG